MKSFTIYRILTYILLAFGSILAFNTIGTLPTALANPLLLIMVFIMACVPLYIFTSSYFFFTGVQKAKPCKPSLKEWIKANAIVSILFAALMFLCSLAIMVALTNPQIFTEAMKQMPANRSQGLTPVQIQEAFKIFAAIMLPLSIILVVHIILTFRLLKLYNHVFNKA